ncbi:MAG: HlyD family efflux transporter periplasmic adaptor subunit [Bacteroidetes bacterium]|nr:HlyD family efflux transporter periplasmic adaptor subunit [Bacteroidota bacterium]
MSKKHNIEIHNEEVREIMKEIPGRLIRWGLTIIFLIFSSIIIGSYFFKFKEIVSVPIIITTTNPPASLISKASGRIAQWFVSDGQKVKKGDNIALIKNSTSLEDLVQAEKIILFLDSTGIFNNLDKLVIPEKLKLGEIQDQFNQFYKNWRNYKDYMETNFIIQKIELLQQQIVKQQQFYKLSVDQKGMIKQELGIVQKSFKRYQNLLIKGGISESQLEEARVRVIQSERGYINCIASLKSTELNMINQKRSMLDLNEQHYNSIEQFELNISDNILTLKNQFNNWRDKYLLSSPINGTLTLTTFWSENQVVSVGKRIATIIPTDSSAIVCRAKVPSTGIGKIEIGQNVNIKLSGYPYMVHGMLTGKIHTGYATKSWTIS